LHRLLEGDGYFLGRQNLENERRKYHEQEEQWLALTNQKHAAYKTYAILDTDHDLAAGQTGGNAGRAFKEYLEARLSMYVLSGACQAIQKLIDECDMRVVPDELRMEIKDE
jgi:hypothetical protein